MLKFREKHTFRRFLYSKVTLFFMFIAVVFVAKSAYGVYVKAQNAGRLLNEAQIVLTQKQDREKYFTQEIERLKSEEGIEEEIRNKFRVGREGEKMVIIMDKEDDNSEIIPLSEEKSTLWEKIKGIFKK